MKACYKAGAVNVNVQVKKAILKSYPTLSWRNLVLKTLPAFRQKYSWESSHWKPKSSVALPRQVKVKRKISRNTLLGWWLNQKKIRL